MRWQDGRESGVEDRRGGGVGAPHIIGGGGIGVVVVVLLLSFVFHVDPRQLLSATDADTTQTASGPAAVSACPQGDETCRFVDVVHTSTDDVWSAVFRSEGKAYRPSTIVLYSQGAQTGCGLGQSAMGPFYCPADEKIYLDLDFFNTLEQQLGARGDFARAYVIAHEEGHHIQKLLGTSDKVTQAQRANPDAANALSVRLELQADCYAGVWAAQNRARIETGDVEEGMRAAHQIGDDTLMKAAGRTPVEAAFTHGSSEQRMAWLRKGLDSGNPAQCNTFAPGAV